MRAEAALFFLAAAGAAAAPGVGERDFAAAAYAALPPEAPYSFMAGLARGEEPAPRDPAAAAAPGELALPARGWKIEFARDSGDVLRTAVGGFQTFLSASMEVQVDPAAEASLAGWAEARRAIVVGTRTQMPGAGAGLTGAKDYRLLVSPEAAVICGFDEAGAMHGLYDLEERMRLREAPILPQPIDQVRRSLYRTRMTLSGLGWDEWPDPYLAMLSRYGIDAIFASAYANPDGSAPPPQYATMRREDPARLQDLIRRARRYGIRVYCPILYLSTGEPDNEAGLRRLVRRLVTQFPGIRGYILLTEGFYYNAWFGAGSQGSVDLRDWLRHWTHAVGIVAEEAHRIDPGIEILPWDYNIEFRPEMAGLKLYGSSLLPQDTIPFLTFENGKEIIRDGEKGYLKDYAITEPGPSEVTAAQIEVAKERGQPVYAKADTWASWQFGTFPYVPVPYQWYARYQALEKWGVAGTLESWSYGFKPNFVAELRAWCCWSGAPALDTLLRAMARREFGAGQEDLALAAWDRFSRGIRLLPDTGPLLGTNAAVGSPLFFQRPRLRSLSLNHSWEDPGRWSYAAEINPNWPYTHSRMVLNVDFDNRRNAASRYAAPFSLPVFLKYERLAAGEFEAGLRSYRAAALRAPAVKRAAAMREVLLAEQMQRMIRSTVAILEFEDERLRLSRGGDEAGQARILDHMTAILQDERARARDALETARRDSRLGYEWEQDYLCPTSMIEEKLKLIDRTLIEFIPAYRRDHALP